MSDRFATGLNKPEPGTQALAMMYAYEFDFCAPVECWYNNHKTDLEVGNEKRHR